MEFWKKSSSKFWFPLNFCPPKSADHDPRAQLKTRSQPSTHIPIDRSNSPSILPIIPYKYSSLSIPVVKLSQFLHSSSNLLSVA
ncbi:unnamed protein product [Citrullus colocynthis]|uniref:Uncharacterized protein n=1 Tax=Citrullus colocynthis TaxID=252529 RepID=A0ABP0XZV8_9ROSI